MPAPNSIAPDNFGRLAASAGAPRIVDLRDAPIQAVPGSGVHRTQIPSKGGILPADPSRPAPLRLDLGPAQPLSNVAAAWGGRFDWHVAPLQTDLSRSALFVRPDGVAAKAGSKAATDGLLLALAASLGDRPLHMIPSASFPRTCGSGWTGDDGAAAIARRAACLQRRHFVAAEKTFRPRTHGSGARCRDGVSSIGGGAGP